MNVIDLILENIYVPLYGICLLVALWKYPIYFDTPLKFLPVLLMYTLLNEILGGMIWFHEEFSLFLHELFVNNNWMIYNIYNLIFFLYFYYVYWCYLKERWMKQGLLLGAVVLIIISVVNAYDYNFYYEPQVYAYFTGAIVLLAAIGFYAFRLQTVYKKWFMTHDLLSWISLGMLIFFTGYLPIKMLRHFRISDPLAWRRIHLLLIVIMYVCFIIGFMRMERTGATQRLHNRNES